MLISAEALRKNDVLLLPFGRTATVQGDPRVGREFVSFRTEHGPTRVERTSEIDVDPAASARRCDHLWVAGGLSSDWVCEHCGEEKDLPSAQVYGHEIDEGP